MVNYLTWFKKLDIQVYDSHSVYDSVLHPLQNITDLADGLPTKQLFAHNHATMDMQPHRGRFSIRHLKHVVLFGLPSWVGLNLLCLPPTWGGWRSYSRGYVATCSFGSMLLGPVITLLLS